MSVKDKVLKMGFEDVIIFDNPEYESAFIGITSDGRAVYDFDLMPDALISEWKSNEKITYDEALEFIDYNVIGFGTGENGPLVLYKYYE